jgi:hypothetical protein
MIALGGHSSLMYQPTVVTNPIIREVWGSEGPWNVGLFSELKRLDRSLYYYLQHS